MDFNSETGMPVLPEGYEWYVEPFTIFNGQELHTYVHIAERVEGHSSDTYSSTIRDLFDFKRTERWIRRDGLFGSREVREGWDYSGLRSVHKHYAFVPLEHSVKPLILSAAIRAYTDWQQIVDKSERVRSFQDRVTDEFSGTYPPRSLN